MSKYQNGSTQNIICNLLKIRKEGAWWDFKQEWHTEISELIKDIVCFANTVHDENCYLIFGISDDYEIVGMTKQRRKQADIIDTISKLCFVGDNYPQISVETITFEEDEVDVLTILNTNLTPVYLKRPYGKMREGCIYNRTFDKNTPDSSNADVADIEMLWKKRFGLTKSHFEYILERLHNRLEWSVQGNTFYNIYRPEYTMVQLDNEYECEQDEFYSYTMCNKKTNFATLQIKCHETILDEFQLVILDSGRYKTPVPEWGFIYQDHYGMQPYYSYKYFVIGENRYLINQFFYDTENQEQRYARERLMKVVLVYESEEEHLAFETFLEGDKKLIDDKIDKIDHYSYVKSGDDFKNSVYIRQLHIGIVLNSILQDFRQKGRNKDG